MTIDLFRPSLTRWAPRLVAETLAVCRRPLSRTSPPAFATPATGRPAEPATMASESAQEVASRPMRRSFASVFAGMSCLRAISATPLP